MANPLSQIGSPLPDHGDIIFKQILEDNIEILNSTLDLHKQSDVVLRNNKELGIDMLNGTWTYTPQYTWDTPHRVSYVIGHAMSDPNSTYSELAKELTIKAEQAMFYAPLRKLRAFLINHDTTTGKTDLRLPDEWVTDIGEGMSVADFLGIVEGYVHEQRDAICASVYEHFYAKGLMDKEVNTRFIFSGGKMVFVHPDCPVPDVSQKYDMTRIFKFIARPWNHGLDQKHLRSYRSIVNL